MSESTMPALSSPKKIPIDEIIYCVDVLKLTHRQTAERLGCSHQNITERLNTYGYAPDTLKQFKENQADIYSIRRLRLNKALTEEKIEQMSAYQIVGMDRMTLDAERLLREQSTQNLAYIDMTKRDEYFKREIHKILKEYDIDEADLVDLLPNSTSNEGDTQ